MEDKREISLKRAKELHNEIADYLEFKEQYISDVSEKRDLISLKHKRELLEYFGGTDEDWDDYHWQLKNRIG